jgi:integrase
LDLAKPVVVLSGEHTKNGQDARQPLPKKIAAKLKKYLKGKPANEQLWNNGCWAHELARASLQRDMKEAGIPVEDERGHKVDFHALRTTYITFLALSGVPMQHAQRLARLSSSQIMMRHYAKIGISELDEQVNRIDYLG